MSNWANTIIDIVNSIKITNTNDVNAVINNSTSNQSTVNKSKTLEQIKGNIIVNTQTELPNNVTGSVDNTSTSNNQKTSALSAWDPRLGRVDGFLAANDAKDHPIIVPFASNTAASAYFNMVFSLESGAKEEILKYATKSGSAETGEKTTSGSATTSAGTDAAVAGYKVYTGNETDLKRIQESDLQYGVASVVNPYTLTRLCGSLKGIQQGQDNTTTLTENRLYDIRDTRRFYDQSVTASDDFTSINNPTTTNIITWSNKDQWGRTPYSFQDFVFCKYWNIIPNNRLITFRKYHAPVYDNLQFPLMYKDESKTLNKMSFAPIATVLTYFGEQTGNQLSSLMSFTTGTKWRDLTAQIYEVSGDSGSDPRAVIDNMFTNKGGFTGAESAQISSLFSKANWVTGKMFSFGKFVGLLDKDGYDIKQDQSVFDHTKNTMIDPQDQLYSNRIQGPVNRIDSTKARDAGIIFDHKMTLTCEYVARPIGGINTKAVMLDILSNCMEIASVDAAWWGGGYKWMIEPHMYPFKNNDFKNSIMDALYAGKIFGNDGALARTVEGVRKFGTADDDPNGSFDWNNVISKMGEFIGESIGAIGNMLSSVGSALFGDGNILSNVIDKVTDMGSTEEQQEKGSAKLKNLLGNVNSMWRAEVVKKTMIPSISNMKAILTGEPVGNWHLVVGNPLNPIMTIGNLICTNMKVTCSDELGPDDFPMEIKVTYDIEHGMAREKGSIQSMFNRGNGKIYDLPDYIKASSDYETKVDDYTGNRSDSGWRNPQFMSVGAMAAAGGGMGGYKKYKLANPQALATLANTDSTVITKFSPVDIDMATSNISNDTTFFGENAGSRAWIRGTAITRKLMN